MHLLGFFFKCVDSGRVYTDQAATFLSSATANSFVKSGGTSSQFLKADGSVDTVLLNILY